MKAAIAAIAMLVIGSAWGDSTPSITLKDLTSPEGHRCTVAVTSDFRGGIAMHCWR